MILVIDKELDDENRQMRVDLLEQYETLVTLLRDAEKLLNSCLEWDNGGERDYDAIVHFLNSPLLKEIVK
jgi:hypothetical protein